MIIKDAFQRTDIGRPGRETEAPELVRRRSDGKAALDVIFGLTRCVFHRPGVYKGLGQQLHPPRTTVPDKRAHAKYHNALID